MIGVNAAALLVRMAYVDLNPFQAGTDRERAAKANRGGNAPAA